MKQEFNVHRSLTEKYLSGKKKSNISRSVIKKIKPKQRKQDNGEFYHFIIHGNNLMWAHEHEDMERQTTS